MSNRATIKGVVKARKCKCCGHHEIVLAGKNARGGEFKYALKPGDKITAHLINMYDIEELEKKNE